MISVIIVTWNNEDLIENCILSLMKNVKKDFISEIIIVDNNSKDKTTEVVQKTAGKLEISIQLIKSKENLGFSKANNLGVSNATGEFLLLLNPDTVIIQSELENLLQYFNDKIGIVSCKLLNIDNSLQPSCYNFDTPINIFLEQFQLGMGTPEFVKRKFIPYNSKHDKNMFVDWCVGAFLIVKKSDFIEIEGFSEDYFLYSEDMDLSYKMKKLLKKETYFISNYQIIHLGGQSEKKDYSSSKTFKLLDSKKTFSIKNNLKFNILTLKFSYSIKLFIYKIALFIKKSEKYKRNQIRYSEIVEYLKGL